MTGWREHTAMRRRAPMVLGLALGALALPPPATAQTPLSCQVVNAASGASSADLYATCPSGALRLGAATDYASAANVAAGLLVVVRQTGLGTEVDLVRFAPDGTARLDELADDIREKFAAAQAGRPMRFTVDLSAFAASGAITAKAADSAASVRLDLLASSPLGAAS